MALVWNAWGLPFLASAALHFAAALTVYFVGPRRLLNRSLAVTMAFGSVIQVGSGLSAMAGTQAEAYALHVVAQLGRFVVPPMYLVFLGAALHTPLVRPMRARGVRAGLVAVSMILPVLAVVKPAWFVGEPVERPLSAYNWGRTPLSAAFDAFSAAVFVFALVASVSAWRRAPAGSPARQRAKWFAFAFGTRDVALAGFLIAAALFLTPGTLAYDVGQNVVLALAATAYVLLIAYGVLSWHLFDLDLRIKGTIRRGALATTFLLVVLLATQLAQNGLADRLGWVWGGVAAGLLLLLLAPLQRAADRLADAVMPGVDGSAEYLAHKRAEVYKGALEEILVDGVVTPKERAILEALRERLGLAAATARALERDVAQALRRPGPPPE